MNASKQPEKPWELRRKARSQMVRIYGRGPMKSDKITRNTGNRKSVATAYGLLLPLNQQQQPVSF